MLCTLDGHLLPRSSGRGSCPCGPSYSLPCSTSRWYYPCGASGLLPRSTGRWSYPCGPSCAANCRCPGLAAEWRRDGQHMGTVAQRGPFFPAGGSEEARLSTRPVHAMRVVALARSSSFLFDCCRWCLKRLMHTFRCQASFLMLYLHRHPFRSAQCAPAITQSEVRGG